MNKGLILDPLRLPAHIFHLQKSTTTSGTTQCFHKVVWQERQGVGER